MAGFGKMLAELLLDSSGFDKNIKKSKKEVDGFSKAGKAMGKELAGQFKKIVGAALALKGAEDVFKAFINSSQTLGDAFAANMTAMRTTVDNFMYSLVTADFTPFNQGLGEMIAKAKEAYAAMDQLGNTQMSVDYLMATSGSNYRTYMANARNKNLSIEERQEWLAKAKEEMNTLKEAQATIARDAKEAIKTQLAATAGIDKKFITDEMINNALLLDSRGSNIQERDALKARYDSLKEEMNSIIMAAERENTIVTKTPYGDVTSKTENYDREMAKARERVQSLMSANADTLIAYAVLFRENDEGLRKLYATAKSAIAAQNQIAEMITSTNEVGAQLSGIKPVSQVSADTITKARNYEADTAMTKLPEASTLEPPAIIQQQNLQKLIDDPFLEKSKEKIKTLEDMNTIVNTLQGSFSQLGSAIGGSAGEMLTFVGSVLNAVQAIIPFIGYLMAEQVAHQGVASAAATEAVAKSFSAHAGIPFAGIALGASAAAAIISTISAIPKFAEGGVVTSATLGVFGEAGPEAVMPLDRLEEFLSPRELHVVGEIKSSGKDLMVIIDNYKRFRNG